ncbi:MAG: hypothetical protein MI863_17145 [Desulfobacterales bacterium]|nr:hypothetical protein [Desulfobacterales bacterium]
MKRDIITNFYILQPRQNILFIQILSAWDGRVADAYIKDLNAITDRFFRDRQWGVLVDLRAWELNTPEAEKKIWESNRSFVNNPTHVATIVGDSETKIWQMKNMLRDVDKFKVELFTGDKAAREWMAAAGYDTFGL